MAEEMGLHARLTADSTNYVQNVDRARDALVDLQQQAKILKQDEQDITKAIEENTKKFGENSQQVKRCKSDLADNVKAQLEVKSQVQQVNAQLSKLQKEYLNAAEAAAKDTKEVNDNAQAFEASAGKMKNAFSAVKGLVVGLAGKTLFDALIGSNAEFEQSMTSFEVLLQSADKAQAQMKELEQFSAETPLQLEDTQKATQLLLSYGVAQEDVMARLQQLGDLSQGNADKFNRVALAYGQMVAKGKVSGEELRQMTEAGVPLLNGLAESMGVTTAELSKLIEKGEVGIPQLNAAMESMTSEGGQFFGMMEKQSQTMSGLWSTFLDTIHMVARQAGEEGFEELKGELQGLLDTMTSLTDSGAAQNIGSGIAVVIRGVTNLIKLLWDLRGVLAAVGVGWAVFKIAPTITTLVTAINLLTNATKLGMTQQVASNILSGKTIVLRNAETGAITLETAAKAKEILATEGATMAQVKLNSAMLASPWFWFPAIIAGVTVAVVSLTESYENQVKKLNDIKQEYDNISSELDSVESELQTTGERIDELNSKEKLTITEEGELEKLKETNEELRVRQELLENERNIKAEEKNFAALETAESLYNTRGLTGDIQQNYKYALKVEEIKKLQKEMESETNPWFLTDYSEKLAKLKAELADIRTEFVETFNEITGTDSASQKMKTRLENSINEMNNVLFSAEELNKLKFDEVLNAEGFKETKEALLDMAQAGTLSPEVITSYQEFNDLMENTGLTVEDIIAELQSLAREVQQSSTGIEDALQGSIDNVLSLMDVVSEYDKEGEVSSQTIQKMLQDHPEYVRYLVQEGEQFKLNKDAIDDLKTAEEQKNAITAEYIEKVKEQEFGTREFANTYSDFIRALTESYPDSPLLQNMAQDLIELNTGFAEGKTTVNEYFDLLQERIQSIDFSAASLQSDEAMQGMFAGFTQATTQGVEYITKQFASGSISVQQYTKSLTEANQNLLDLYTTSNDLTQVDGQWVNAAGEVDTYAASLQNAQGALAGFDPFISTISNNIDYLTAHMDSFGMSAFTAADMASSSFQTLASDFEADMESMYSSNQQAFDAIVNDVASATGLMVSDITNGNGQIVDGIFNNNVALNAGINSANNQLGQSISKVTQAAGNLITALGKTIANFDYKISLKPNVTSFGKFDVGEWIKTGGQSGIELPNIDWNIKGSGGTNVAELSMAIADFGTALSSVDFGGLTLNSYKPKTPSTTSTAPRNTSSNKKSSSPKSKTSDSDKAARDAEKAAREAEQARKEQVEQYKDAIEEVERLDERYVERQAAYGRYTDNDVLYALGERAKRYRQYAEDVLNVEYMTEEEKLQLRQEYTEKAEDLELQYFQDAQKRDEEFLQERYDKQLEESKNWIDYQKTLNAMTVDDEIEAGWRIIKAAEATYEEVMNDARLSVDFRTDMLEELNSVIEEYNVKEITLNQEKWDTIISDMQDATDKIISMYDKMRQASDRWISIQKGRDNLSVGDEIDAYGRIIDGIYEELYEGNAKYDEEIAAIEQKRREYLESGNYTELSPEIKDLDKKLEEIREEYKDFQENLFFDIDEVQNTRYNLYKDFLQEQVQDFIEAEREKVNAHYDALQEMRDQEDRDKKRRELEEQIKQYEGAVTKEGKEKLEDLLDQLEDLNKEEEQLKNEQQREEELDALDQLEEGLLKQAEIKAQLVFDDNQVANEIKELIKKSDVLAQEFANNFINPLDDFFKNKLPQQIEEAFQLSDSTIASWNEALSRTGVSNVFSDDHRDYSRNTTYQVTVHTHSNADLSALGLRG